MRIAPLVDGVGWASTPWVEDIRALGWEVREGVVVIWLRPIRIRGGTVPDLVLVFFCLLV